MKLIFLFSSLLLFTLSAQKPGKYKGHMPPAIDTSIASRAVIIKGDPMGLRQYTLSNGLQIFLSVNKKTPRIQTYIAVRAGSKNDPPDNTGLAHYLEHMLFKGTAQFGSLDYKKESAQLQVIENLFEIYKSTQDSTKRAMLYHNIDSVSQLASTYAIANEYDKLMSHLGAEGTNAFTWFDQTVYVNDIPSNQIKTWLHIEAERFKDPVFRLFHTELEAVYEEKNRSLDNDDDKVWDAMFNGLFPDHTYGTQTTIGTIAHLKNPSLKAIREFYTTYYVPNNMALILCGDFNPDEIIREIESAFGYMKSKALPKRISTSVFKPLAQPIHLYGPNPESLLLGFRYPAAGTPEADCALLSSLILHNGTAGLLDLNINQAQRALSSNVVNFNLNEHSFFGISASPKSNQSLEALEQIIQAQIQKLQQGDFPDWLIKAVITDLKLKNTKNLEQNSSRAYGVLNAFINGVPWINEVNYLKRLEQLNKSDIMRFANLYLKDSLAVRVYKHTGTDSSVKSVVKPSITPVGVNRNTESEFVKHLKLKKPETEIQPSFINFSTAVSSGTFAPGISYMYQKNNDNELFECYIRLKMGSQQNTMLPVAIQYIPFLGTSKQSPQAIKEELYRLGCTINVFNDAEQTWINLSGLKDGFIPAFEILIEMLQHPKINPQKLKNLIEDILKNRADAKLDKRILLNRALMNYVLYGADNPFTHQLSNDALKNIQPQQLEALIASLLKYEAQVLFYGPVHLDSLARVMHACYPLKTAKKPCPPFKPWTQSTIKSGVFAAEFDMTQTEVLFISKGAPYNIHLLPQVNLFNAYFGGGMSSIVFQELRESKALAYSTYARYMSPTRSDRNFINVAYIGSQADKLEDALKGMVALLDSLPYSQSSFENAKSSVMQEIQTQRINNSEVFFKIIQAQALDHTVDVRETIYKSVPSLTFKDLHSFHKTEIKQPQRSILIIGKKENLNSAVLKPYGNIQFLDLKTLYGY